MAIIMRDPALDRALRSISVTFQDAAAKFNRALNRTMAPMKGIGISMTAIFRRSGITPASISQDSSAPRKLR